MGRDWKTGQSLTTQTMIEDMKTLTIACKLTLTSPGRSLGMNGNATPTTKAARAVTQLNLFSGYGAAALHP